MGKRILIVEDDLNLREIYQDSLGNEGYEIRIAENGLDALVAIEQEEVDLILTDIRMPGLSGIEVVQEVRSRSPELPIIVCTAVKGMESDFDLQVPNVVAVFTKPVKLDALIEAAAKALGA